jgi:hypothetical protein
VSSVLLSVNMVVTKSRTLPSVTLGKGCFAKCDTRQRLLYRVPDKKQSTKLLALAKESDFGSDVLFYPLQRTRTQVCYILSQF